PADQQRKQFGVLVIGVRSDDEDPLDVAQHRCFPGKRRQPAGGGRCELGGKSLKGNDQKGEEKGKAYQRSRGSRAGEVGTVSTSLLPYGMTTRCRTVRRGRPPGARSPCQ